MKKHILLLLVLVATPSISFAAYNKVVIPDKYRNDKFVLSLVNEVNNYRKELDESKAKNAKEMQSLSGKISKKISVFDKGFLNSGFDPAKVRANLNQTAGVFGVKGTLYKSQYCVLANEIINDIINKKEIK